jgi:glycosyltransferase involved in cell wall biosynthesis
MLWDKGVGEYVEAGRKVRLLYPKVRFQLLGFLDVANPSAIARQQMDDWVAEGVVEYLGQTDDVRPLLLQADCVVLPSCYREGVPRSLLEAAASARPVITTDAPGCRDTVVDGESGYLCRPGDAADLADKMFRFIDLAPQTRKAMGQVSRSHAERHFDERLVISRYLTLVRSIGPCK